MRVFTRHDSAFPLEVLGSELNIEESKSLLNISTGGLAFGSGADFIPGTILRIRISFVKPVFCSNARVVWSMKSRDSYIVGVEFIRTDDIFKIRMVEQICQIENFKLKQKSENNITLSSSEAALEWQSRYAGTFAAHAVRKSSKVLIV